MRENKWTVNKRGEYRVPVMWWTRWRRAGRCDECGRGYYKWW
jgi:hypothetical protein